MKGAKRTLGIFFVVLVLTAGLVGAAEEQPLVNADIIKLTKLAMGDDVIMTKIKTAKEVKFDTSTDDLVKLKEAGVSGPIIAAMLERSVSGAVSGTASTTGSVNPKNDVSAMSFSVKGKVWIPDGEKLIQLNSVAGYYETSMGQAFRAAFTFTVGYAVFANETKAKIRLKTSPTVIYTRHVPSESGVALFTVEENRRSIWLEQKRGSNQASLSPEEKDMKYDEEMIADDVYKLTFKKPLNPGEYGFITPGGSTKYLIYDFAVEP